MTNKMQKCLKVVGMTVVSLIILAVGLEFYKAKETSATIFHVNANHISHITIVNKTSRFETKVELYSEESIKTLLSKLKETRVTGDGEIDVLTDEQFQIIMYNEKGQVAQTIACNDQYIQTDKVYEYESADEGEKIILALSEQEDKSEGDFSNNDVINHLRKKKDNTSRYNSKNCFYYKKYKQNCIVQTDLNGKKLAEYRVPGIDSLVMVTEDKIIYERREFVIDYYAIPYTSKAGTDVVHVEQRERYVRIPAVGEFNNYHIIYQDEDYIMMCTWSSDEEIESSYDGLVYLYDVKEQKMTKVDISTLMKTNKTSIGVVRMEHQFLFQVGSFETLWQYNGQKCRWESKMYKNLLPNFCNHTYLQDGDEVYRCNEYDIERINLNNDTVETVISLEEMRGGLTSSISIVKEKDYIYVCGWENENTIFLCRKKIDSSDKVEWYHFTHATESNRLFYSNHVIYSLDDYWGWKALVKM